MARGVAWLQAQQGVDGRIGTNQFVAVTALGWPPCAERRRQLRILNGRGVGLEKAELFLKGYLAGNPTNAGWAVFNGEVCRNVLKLGSSKEQGNWAGAWARQDQDDRARAREFELREIAWKKQRAELVKKGADPDRFRAAQLAQSCAVNDIRQWSLGGVQMRRAAGS